MGTATPGNVGNAETTEIAGIAETVGAEKSAVTGKSAVTTVKVKR